jgi:hypothetical protein
MERVGRKSAIVAALVAAVIGLGYAGWRLHTTEGQTCGACRRPIHAGARTIGHAGGQNEVFCCPACALTDHRQTGQAVTITALTDFETDAPLDPRGAYIVEGSNLNLCVRQHHMVGEHKHATPMEFDRCSPSIFAFGRRDAADRFLREHGGRLIHFQDLAPAYQR